MTAATAPYAIEMGLLHMLLFWTLILFDSYAYSYKNRGCRMCNSPFHFICFYCSAFSSFFFSMSSSGISSLLMTVSISSSLSTSSSGKRRRTRSITVLRYE